MAARCVEPVACAADEDCLGARVCLGSICAPPCTEAPGCAGAQTCDEETGHCREPAACTGDVDCLASRACVGGQCRTPECGSHADCLGDCVDRLCVEPSALGCVGDGQCAAPLRCSPVGVCAAEPACDQDADCPAFLPYCDGVRGLCLACRGDEDCAPSEACRAGHCSLERPCAGAGDCPGDRFCDGDGLCSPAPGCAGDLLDGLGGLAPLQLRTYSDLVLCDGDEDRYGVDLAAGQSLAVELRHDAGAGDLSLAYGLFDALVFEQGAVDLPWGWERLEFAAAPRPRRLELSVRGRAGRSVGYSLDLRPLAEGRCPADAWEGPWGNDSPDSAAPLPRGEHEALLCPGDQDWFLLDLPLGQRLVLELEAEQAVQSVAASLVDGSGAVLENAVSAGERCTCTVDPGRGEICECQPDDGRHLLLEYEPAAPVPGLRLWLRGAGGLAQALPLRLALRFEGGVGELAAVCEGAPTLAAAVPRPLGLVDPPRSFVESSCGFSVGQDQVLRVELAQAGSVELSLEGSGLASALSLRRDCVDPASELGCSAGEDPVLRVDDLAAGTYFVMVQGAGGAGAELRLDLP